MKFEWDENKNRINFDTHGLYFNDILGIFFNDYIIVPSHKPNEKRWLRIGELDGKIITAVYTKRQEKIRLISARSASKKEKKRYREHFPE